MKGELQEGEAFAGGFVEREAREVKKPKRADGPDFKINRLK